MPIDIEVITKDLEEDLNSARDSASLEVLRIKYVGKKGILSEILSCLGDLPSEQRPLVGKRANELKNKITAFIKEKEIEFKSTAKASGKFDITLPGIVHEIGRSHPLTQVTEEICAIFNKIGFKIIDSPEIETEFNNFTALNIPLEHPSRDVFDTFYLESPQSAERRLLRSHTSPGQARVMKQYKPPLAVVVPGKVYRPDAVDASHSFMFHQVEGFLVDKEVKFSDLKGVLAYFCQELFGQEVRMRFRPHFFPFTEPSAEIDVSCIICKGKGCSVCGKKGWLEILGAGMVHPNVFKAVGYPPGKYTGFAFGMGVERIAMLKYGINDIRLFFENDLRFLKQF
ncbi:MAG: phenylalanine--tRNA ligase subunit alpha [Candidatus Omnitrophota bacterium]|nr:phenylalanine--tRNA ligase subunit alpha [Candidatus Omnitrophota bacterium]